MKIDFITSSTKLSSKFIQLAEKYKYIAFASAWATSQHSAYQKLLEKPFSKKIQFSTIGLHFYQTDPVVLKEFQNHKQVNFSQQLSGVFHPKTYLFWNDETDWAVLTGSANFTKGGFDGKNSENMVYIESDEDNYQFFIQVRNFLQDCFEKAEKLTDSKIKNYETLHKLRRKEREVLANSYNNQRMEKDILSVDILNYTWDEYYQSIQNDPYHSFTDRLKMLENISSIFNSYADFSMLSLEQRKLIAGISGENSGWFGSMVGNGKFKNAINTNSKYISKAINQIPLIGEVTSEDFFNFIEIYQSEPQFADKPNSLGSATRLLSMKRPDLFFCFNSKNREAICDELGIKNRQKINAERYWFEILQRIYDTPWFNSNKPKNSIKELQAWNSRVALLDCIYYAPES